MLSPVKGTMAFLLALLFTSCLTDDTTLATRELSEITLLSGVDSIYNINKNDTLHIVPLWEQNGSPKSVTVMWEIDQTVVSTEPELVWVARTLGTYPCRLILVNDDGKTFVPFTLNVNTPYEEGITVISVDGNGHSRLSFMLTQTDPHQDNYFYDYDCFAVNNPDYAFASNVTDMVQSSGSLLVACQGDRTGRDASDVPTIYYLNAKTFQVENIVTAPEYPDFIPTRVVVPSEGFEGIGYPVLCENGHVYEFSTTDGVIAPPVRLRSVYAPSCMQYDGGNSSQFTFLFWDEEVGDLCNIYNGYGPFYCSKTYHTSLTDIQQDPTTNFYKGYSLLQIVECRRTLQQRRAGEDVFALVITKSGLALNKTILLADFWDYDYNSAQNYLRYEGTGITNAGFGITTTFGPSTPCIAGCRYHTLFYAAGGKVMKWNYTSTQALAAATVHATVGSDRAVITGFEYSADQSETFVAFYEPDEPGLNGHIWVIDTAEGTLLRRYDNVCYRPTKIMYKEK